MKSILNLIIVVTVATFAGCANDSQTQTAGTPNATSSTTAGSDGQQYLAASEPVGSVGVGEARVNAKDGDAVTLVGNIGGSTEPFVNGIAAFTIVDPKVGYCPPEEGCPTPWDYCCTQNEVKDNIATVKVVNEAGKPVSKDARQLLGVKELSMVVVEGIAKRDEQGNLSVLASKVFVKQ